MNFFERELRKLFANSATLENARFAGRVCIARLTDVTNVKLEFVTLGHADHYEGIKATVINRNEGQVDSTVFRFGDILGPKQTGNSSLRDGAMPHIWKGNRDYEWYARQPTPADYEKLTETVDDYLELFQTPVQSQNMTQQMR